jgi:hypothetical protein
MNISYLQQKMDEFDPSTVCPKEAAKAGLLFEGDDVVVNTDNVLAHGKRLLACVVRISRVISAIEFVLDDARESCKSDDDKVEIAPGSPCENCDVSKELGLESIHKRLLRIKQKADELKDYIDENFEDQMSETESEEEDSDYIQE